MTLRVQLERNSHRLRFEEFPTAPLDYREDKPQDNSSFVHLKVTDAQTKRVVSIYFKTNDLQRIGISLQIWKTISPNSEKLSKLLCNASCCDRLLQEAVPIVSKHLTPEYLAFFK